MKAKRTSMMIAIPVMFVMAILSFFAGSTPEVCCVRALVGAAVAYVLTSWALNIVAGILASVSADSKKEEAKVNNVAPNNGR